MPCRFSGLLTREKSGETRYSSFAAISAGNNVKFHVDGCAYFWAVSEGLLAAKESIWIMGWWVSPEVYLRRPPSENEQYRLDRMLLAAAERGVKVNVIVFKEVPVVMCLSSDHTKRALEALHPNVSVFRYPDHIQQPLDVLSAAKSIVEEIAASGKTSLGDVTDEVLQAAFRLVGGPTLLWAHHEKLAIIDQHLAFVGGLDLSYGRWDPVQHPIADAHPGDLDGIIYPGQDYNNARVMDYANLDDWRNNELSRLTTSRLGWEDISVSLTGPAVADICQHFVDRWNFVHDVKYNADLAGMRDYQRLSPPKPPEFGTGSMNCQLVRSVSHWSNGIATENSLYNAYVDIIENSEHFLYLEQQFFITATDHWPRTIWNRVGEAFVARILRAARENKRYKVIVVLPAVPAFPGDIQALIAGQQARALMKLQYDSINRGGYSVFDKLKSEGINPDEYIRFYNLRTYDRIKGPAAVEHTNVEYNTASQEHDDMVDPVGFRAQSQTGPFQPSGITAGHQAYSKYQDTSSGSTAWDTVSSCYMLGGEDIRKVPFSGESEIDTFVSEELYVHTKLMIADDRVVLCGSANLNDRSLKGSRDSEIAIVVEDKTPLETTMNGQPFQANKFAASFRRYLFRNHLGLLRPQDMRKPDGNFLPAPAANDYDFGSAEDQLVADPLSDAFQQLWYGVAHENTLAFRKVFFPMPDDTIKTWLQYQAVFWERFNGPEGLHMAQWGHVQKNNFASGEEGVKQVKEELSKIRGTLVEMPLDFLIDSNIEPEGLGYNIITRQGYA
ncbi:hypothetical protein BDV18DRAFT_166572 [Aspergillus unguis]